MDYSSLIYEGDVTSEPIITEEIRIAIREFVLVARYEKELSSESQMIEHMMNAIITQVFINIIDGKPEEESIALLNRSAQAFKQSRQQYSGNPTRMFHREHLEKP